MSAAANRPASQADVKRPASSAAATFGAADQRAEWHIDLPDVLLAQLAARAGHPAPEVNR